MDSVTTSRNGTVQTSGRVVDLTLDEQEAILKGHLIAVPGAGQTDEHIDWYIVQADTTGDQIAWRSRPATTAQIDIIHRDPASRHEKGGGCITLPDGRVFR